VNLEVGRQKQGCDSTNDDVGGRLEKKGTEPFLMVFMSSEMTTKGINLPSA
jgi:hypothetical protein